MSRTRRTYVRLDSIVDNPTFILEEKEIVGDYRKCRLKRIDILSLLRVILPLKTGPLSGSKLLKFSGIRSKKAYYRYLNFCLEYEFIQKFPGKWKNRYELTPRGRIFIGLFYNKEALK